MLVADWPVKDRYSIENVSFRDVRIDGTGTSVLSARAMGSASFENVDARNVGDDVTAGLAHAESHHLRRSATGEPAAGALALVNISIPAS